MTMRVTHLSIYPLKGEPAVDLSTVEVAAEGLAGDRRKKAAVHLVTMTDVAEAEDPPRANIVVDSHIPLADLAGQRVTLGSVTLSVTRQPSSCPGVYAEVVTPGQVSVGDDIEAV